MACNSFNTISLDCLENVGGIDSLYIMAWSNLDTTADTNGFEIDTVNHTITGITFSDTASTAIFQEFQINESSGNYVGTRDMDVSVGTQGRVYELTANISKNDGVTRKTINDMEKQRLVIIVKMNDNRYVLLGSYKGGYMTGLTDESGTAYTGDLNGFTLAYSAFERGVAFEVSSTLINSSYITFA